MRLTKVRLIDLEANENVDYGSIDTDMVSGVSEWVLDLDKVTMYRPSPRLPGATDLLFSDMELTVILWMDFDTFDKLMKDTK